MKKPVAQSKLDMEVVILCPEFTPNDLKVTLRSVANNCYNRACITVVPDSITPKQLKEAKEICPTYKGGNTFTSLINMGMSKVGAPWAFIVYSGSVVKPYTERKLDLFTTSEKDILFPVVNMKMNFVEGSTNGLLINKKTFQEVGAWPNVVLQNSIHNEFEMSKLLWYLDAIPKGVIFKGIIGLRVK